MNKTAKSAEFFNIHRLTLSIFDQAHANCEGRSAGLWDVVGRANLDVLWVINYSEDHHIDS